LPNGIGRSAVVVAAATWLGALVGGALGSPFPGWVLIGIGLVGLGVARSPGLVILFVVGIGAVSGAVATGRLEATLGADLPRGRGTLIGVAATDSGRYGDLYRFVVRPDGWGTNTTGLRPWRGPAVAVLTDEPGVVAGDHVSITGLIRRDPDLIRGDPVAGRVTAKTLTVERGPDSPVMIVGNVFRSRVQSQIAAVGPSPEAALLKGFLIGDIAGLPEADTESLRRAGLTHFVAVSGSNVALVLGAWWLVLGPVGAGTRIRAVTGLIVLAVFVVATRWESSVIRAATMASLVLGGRAAGIVVDAWAALGAAVAVLLVMSGDLAYDIGFQLSAVATAGVLLGSRLWSDRSPRLVWALLAATVSAQVAVAPILLLHFGTVPLLAPIANLIAAPMVTVATALAGIGVIVGWAWPLQLASWTAGMVLHVARVVGEWPQLGPAAVIGMATLIAVTWWARVRWVAAVVVAAIALFGLMPVRPPAVPTVVFIDVGQGDAVLLRDPSGAVVLMDGGREPAVLRQALRRYGIKHIDLLIASHGDADHVGGFTGLVDAVPIGQIWVPQFAVLGDILDGVVADAGKAGVPVALVKAGDRARTGEFTLDVLNPVRRYATDNDGSVVVVVSSGGRTILLPGDISAVAQSNLQPRRPDVLLVPHHGAATTDPRWLAETVGDLAVISVGPNTYGHPAPEIMTVLESRHVNVLTTMERGDIVIPLR
jgi:competence protein ComEC